MDEPPRASERASIEPGGAPRLVEREDEFAGFERGLDAASAGGGSVLALLGEPGIGKTSLLGAMGTVARERGACVLNACGTQLEQGLPFGIARQLFERLLVQGTPEQRSGLLAGQARLAEPLLSDAPVAAFDGDPFAAIHSLYWLSENLARQAGPVVLSVDDVHCADRASLRFLAYLANRLEGVPILVAVAAIEGELDSEDPLLDELLRGRQTHIMRPVALSPIATAELVDRSLGAVPDPEFAYACHIATGGNPYLIKELAAELASNRVEPTSDNASLVSELGSASVGRRVCAWLAQFGDGHIAFGRAFSVLDSGATIHDVAGLAGLDEPTADRVADDLARVGLIYNTRPLKFQHPLVSRAIYADTPASARSRLHARAARLLAERSAKRSVVAAHLLKTEPTGDPWAVEHLRADAADALARGDPSGAIRVLRRALTEPPPLATRPALVFELGAAALRAGEPDALDLMREALALAPDPLLRATAALELGVALGLAGEVKEAARVVDRALGELDGIQPELTIPLVTFLRVMAVTAGPAASLVADRLQADTTSVGSLPAPLAGIALAALALESAVSVGDENEAGELAERALAEGLLDHRGGESPPLYWAAVSLIGADRADRAEQVLSAAMEEARGRSSARSVAMASAFRSYARTRTGNLPGAEEDAVGFREHLEETGARWPLLSVFAFSSLALVHLERGEFAAAEAEFESLKRVSEEMELRPWLQPLHDTFARLLMESGEWEAARHYLLHGGGPCPANPAGEDVTPDVPAVFRATAAIAIAALGRSAEARALAADAVEQARRFGAPRSLGIALRAAALVAEGEGDRVHLLDQAVNALATSCDRLEHARVLVDLGAATRRSGERSKSRKPLRAGLQMAQRCGATALAERAYTELRATGARPRKIVGSGVEQLTPSERRVAAMAADGMSNRDIAQALFITVKTVEAHLGHAYQKLEISSRRELARALGRGRVGSPPGTI